ncbi:MAG: hypothetical protein H8D92_00235 [Pelagibacteraceae bacterium]|nr:hypothetical protein [Pelagibacteraceae bacterium]
MSKFKSYNTFINEAKYDHTGKLNRDQYDNNWVGAIGHTFNKSEEVKNKAAAEKILKDPGIKYTKFYEGYNGMIHYRAEPEWTNYKIGSEPKTGEMSRGSMTIALYDPNQHKLFTEPTDMMNGHLEETVGIVNAPIDDEQVEEFPEIAIEKKDTSNKGAKELGRLLKELYTTALTCEYDGHKIKETLSPKYKGTRVKMNVTDEGKFMFDSFGRYPDVIINLKKKKEGSHTNDTIKEEIKKHVKKIVERIAGMPSMSQISSFED